MTNSVACLFPISRSCFSLGALTVAVALLVASGCSRQPDAKSSITILEKAFPGISAALPANASPPPGGDAKTCVQFALASVRSNDYATAVLMLNTAVRAPGLTPDQFLAVQQARNTLSTDLETRAEKGDAGAQAALKTIEQARAR